MQSEWAKKRKLLYSGILFILILIIVGVPAYLVFYKKPTCFDGKQNQNEKGIDCGGICARICASDIQNPIFLWQRAFQVAPGVYNAVAYIQNPNVDTEVRNVGYIFKLYDDKNSLILQKEGRTFIPANQTFAVFEAGLRTGDRVPVRATFDFTEIPKWSDRLSTLNQPTVSVQNIILKNEATTPRLEASVQNKSLLSVKSLEAVAIIYDANDNAIAASRTVVDNLKGQTFSNIVFTWPGPFSGTAVRKEVVTRIFPSDFSY